MFFKINKAQVIYLRFKKKVIHETATASIFLENQDALLTP